MKAARGIPRYERAVATATAFLLAAGVLAAHDFWIIPNAFQLAPGGMLEVRGQTSSRFPTSEAAVAIERVAEARLIGAASDERLADLSISGRSLILRHRPAGEGQRVVAVALVQRSARTTPEQLQRYIALEGAPQLAERYQREGRYPAVDSLTRLSAKFAKTIVDVGSGRSRAFDRVVGHILEIVPLDDPSALRAGDTLSVRVLYHGQPVSEAHLHGGVALPDSSGPHHELSAETADNGVARIVVGAPGLWNVRLIHGAPAQNAGATDSAWEVHFATLVFEVRARR